MLLKKTSIVILACVALLQVGCATKQGGKSLSSDYVYPNSNVTPIKPVSAEKTWFSIVIPPTFEKEDYYLLRDKLTAQVPEADLITDYEYDVETTQWLPVPYIGVLSPYTMKITVRGMASKMEVGKQELK